ncbi:hypothetical protein [Singulisphaera acidiphila]|uniref:Uncharacterized protein n=1 Tax=Singulisphaera acidiphila (strain ATCC BAA-1392 / DSM 18658 / VKM B-2454 / MOB10) TaxID=886293 RepID=L0DQ54_SINAD|nr:hypothetical protein [Singulisphaera acidiphila]AGA31499.1 hypothetical protein Sinac_7465 [Singulisphaera acidiphila DSM 18658]
MQLGGILETALYVSGIRRSVLDCQRDGQFSGIKVAYLRTQRDLGVPLDIFNGLSGKP